MIHFGLILLLIYPMVALGDARDIATGGDRPSIFTRDDGDVIELDIHGHSRRGPRSQGAVLRDCGDDFQTCLIDDRGFAFSYFRKCNSQEADDYGRLRYVPKTVMILHNDVWMVFDASPNFMFHYRLGQGLIGIYVGKTPSYDFRILLGREKRSEDFSEGEYRLTVPRTAVSCEG